MFSKVCEIHQSALGQRGGLRLEPFSLGKETLTCPLQSGQFIVIIISTDPNSTVLCRLGLAAVGGRPTPSLPVRGCQSSTLEPQRRFFLRAMCPAHYHFSFATR
ncbi:jg21118 [Pararge aegeria aegeria]|uniref:Jg21118 protein n=1 Tax=Pararge aegeria aegeria TaxID=348720 RepID=A0A8S4RNE1_9NEOP|nr:jg21118 [Pararge aegeria aegeria]